ncbi:MAG: leucine-rich repeat protein [Clostridia bacterium]|nr:leucine-rich repeat protein [Clostridia bacterium]
MSGRILKITSFILAWIFISSSLPILVSSEESRYDYVKGLEGIRIKRYYGTDAEVVIPSEIDGIPVVSIGEYAFSNAGNITSVVIPEGIKSIGPYAFYSCTVLENVILPESMTEIGDSAFSGCSSLTDFRFPAGVKKIGADALSNCTSLVSVSLPDSLDVLSGGLFAQDSSLESIIIPNTVRNVGSNAFSECTSLKRIEIPSSVEHIFDYAFAWCASLEEAVIADGVKIIDYRAFSHCESLKRVVFPGSVNMAGYEIFYECPSLEEIVYGATEEKWKIISEGFAPEVADASIVFTSSPMIVNHTNAFRDVDEKKWFAPYIDYVYSYGLMKGAATVPEGIYFLPEDTMTRAMMVTVIWRLEGMPKATKHSGFFDLKKDWYREAVDWAAETGVVKGIGKNTFSPDALLTREQICTMMYRYAKYKGEPILDNGGVSFFDSGKISSWAKDAVIWAVAEAGLIIGEKIGNKTYLNPQGKATRAQIATILTRYLENHNGTLNATCREKGHLLISSFAEEIVHNVFEDSPHCQKRVWEIFMCGREGCGFIRKVLRSVKRVSFCHG